MIGAPIQVKFVSERYNPRKLPIVRASAKCSISKLKLYQTIVLSAKYNTNMKVPMVWCVVPKMINEALDTRSVVVSILYAPNIRSSLGATKSNTSATILAQVKYNPIADSETKLANILECM